MPRQRINVEKIREILRLNVSAQWLWEEKIICLPALTMAPEMQRLFTRYWPATCKLNDIEPFGWLKNALETIPDYPANQLHKLIPGQK